MRVFSGHSIFQSLLLNLCDFMEKYIYRYGNLFNALCFFFFFVTVYEKRCTTNGVWKIAHNKIKQDQSVECKSKFWAFCPRFLEGLVQNVKKHKFDFWKLKKSKTHGFTVILLKLKYLRKHDSNVLKVIKNAKQINCFTSYQKSKNMI